MSETWYIMEDETAGDPRDIRPGADGKLVHKDGRKVAYAPHGPRSRGVDAEAERAKKALPKPQPRSAPDKDEEAVSRDMKPAPPKRTYTTRQAKTVDAE